MRTATRLFVLAATVAAASAANVPASVHPGSPDPLGLGLLPPAVCGNERNVRQCVVAQPKEWSDEERRLLRDTVDRLAANELVQGLIAGARENGYQGLRRYATDTKDDASLGPVPMFSPGFVLYTAKVVGITDAFFQTHAVRDPLSGYRLGDLFLVHELGHAFDDRKCSAERGFTTLAGWHRTGNGWQYRNRLSYSDYLSVYAETLTFYGTGRYDEAWARDRRFATSLAFPLPTIQSLVSPDETFADMLAHLIVDPRASSYLESGVVAWFEQHVFPALREKARAARKPIASSQHW